MATILVEILGEAKQFKHEMGEAVKSTEKAHSGFAKLGLVAAGAGAVIGGALVAGLGKSVEAAIASQQATARLNTAFAASHVSAKAFAGAIDDAESRSRKLGFTNEDVRGSLGSLIVATHNGRKAISDLAVAQDVARFKGISLEAATKTITMAMAGSQRATKALGIDVPKVTTAQDALAASTKNHTSELYKNELAHAKIVDRLATENAVIATVTEKLHGQAAAYAGTAAGSMAQFHAQLGNLEEQIGTALLPAFTAIVKWLTKELPVAVAEAKRAIAFLTPYFMQVKTAVEDVVAVVRSHWTEISAIITGVVNIIKAELNLFGDLIHGRWSQIWTDVVNLAKAAKNTIIAEVKLIGPLLRSALEAIGRLAIQGLESGLKALPGALSAAMAALPGLALTAATLIGDAIVKGVKTATPHITGLAGDLTGKIGDALGQVASWAFGEAEKIGMDIANGVVDGVGNLASTLASKLTGAVGSALGSAKSALGISSPSKVFADQLGAPMVDGISAGMLARAPALATALGQTLQTAMAAGLAVAKSAQATFQAVWSSFASSADAAFQKIQGSVKTKSEGIIATMQAAAQSAQLSSALSAAQGQLVAAQTGAPQSDAEKALAVLQSVHDATGRGQALSAAQTQLATAQAGGDAAAILQAQQAISDAQYNIQVAGLNNQIAAEQAANTQKNAITQAQVAVDAANKAISDAAAQASLDKQAADERTQLDATNVYRQSHFDAALAALQKHLANGHATYKQANQAILKLFKNFGVDYTNAGAALGDAFVKGLGESIQNAANKAGDVTSKTSGIGAAIAGAVGGAVPHLATGGFVSQSGLAVIHAGETVVPAGAGGGGVNITINGMIGDEQVEQLRNILIRTGRRTTGGALGGFA